MFGFLKRNKSEEEMSDDEFFDLIEQQANQLIREKGLNYGDGLAVVNGKMLDFYIQAPYGGSLLLVEKVYITTTEEDELYNEMVWIALLNKIESDAVSMKQFVRDNIDYVNEFTGKDLSTHEKGELIQKDYRYLTNLKAKSSKDQDDDYRMYGQ